MPGTATDLVGQSLGPYHLERLIGQGGVAWVFVGREADGTPVAVKVLKPQYAGDSPFEARFRNESGTAAKLEHPNIIRIRSVAKTGTHVYFAMDLCPDSLGARLAREGPLPEADILRIASDVARGLGFAHEQGLIHRDLKPDNILLRSDGRALIADFGIARAVSGHVASTGDNMTIGTPQYLSPEQAQGRSIDQRADIYGLGVTLYKAATGDVPFTHSDWFELARMHVEDPPPSLRRKRPELSKHFERVVSRCLAKHPDDRYQTAAEFAADLGYDPTQRSTLDGDVASAPRPNRRWRLIAAIGVGLIVLAVLVVLFIRRTAAG
jgi:serine/threonine-protein kinase